MTLEHFDQNWFGQKHVGRQELDELLPEPESSCEEMAVHYPSASSGVKVRVTLRQLQRLCFCSGGLPWRIRLHLLHHQPKQGENVSSQEHDGSGNFHPWI